MTGKEAKKMIVESGLKCLQVAEAWGLCDSNFSRRLRKPFSDEEICRLILIPNQSIDKIHFLPVMLFIVSLDNEQIVSQSLSTTF